jgi:hypothetical protein
VDLLRGRARARGLHSPLLLSLRYEAADVVRYSPKMKPRHLYAALSAAGAVLPFVPFLPWLATHGLDVPLFLRDLFANGVAGAFAIDIIVSAVVVCAFVLIEGRRVGVRHLWAPIVGILVGVCFALPLFLYLRERRLDEITSREVAA